MSIFCGMTSSETTFLGSTQLPYTKELPIPDQAMELHDARIKHYLFYKYTQADKSNIGLCSKCGKYHNTVDLFLKDNICDGCGNKLITSKITKRFNPNKYSYETAGEVLRKVDGYIVYSYIIGYTSIHPVFKTERTIFREVERLYSSTTATTEDLKCYVQSMRVGKLQILRLRIRRSGSKNEESSVFENESRSRWAIQCEGFNSFRDFFSDTAAKYTHLGDWLDSQNKAMAPNPENSWRDTKSILIYYNSVIKWPYVEMLWKFGFRKLYDAVMNGAVDRRVIHKKSLIENRKELLKIGDPSPSTFQKLLVCKRYSIKYTVEELEKVDFNYYNIVGKAMKLTQASQGKVERFLKEVIKYTGINNEGSLTATWWIDYLEMTMEIEGYIEGKKAFPMDAVKAHNDMLLIKHLIDAERQTKKIIKEMPNLVREFEESVKKNKLEEYEYSDQSGLLVVAIKSIKELVDEGAILKHCVGGVGYIESVAEGRSFIFSIRSVDDPRVPLATIELEQGKIRQCYGYGSRKDTLPPGTDELVENWQQHIKSEMFANA